MVFLNNNNNKKRRPSPPQPPLAILTDQHQDSSSSLVASYASSSSPKMPSAAFSLSSATTERAPSTTATSAATAHPRLSQAQQLQSRSLVAGYHQPKSSVLGHRSSSLGEGSDPTLDLTQLRFDHTKLLLFGRDEEKAVLKEAIQWQQQGNAAAASDTRTSKNQLILISGPSGVGKTSLVHAVLQDEPQPPNVDCLPFVVAQGKYDFSQEQPQVPYAALTQACRELCDSYNTTSENNNNNNETTLTTEQIRELRDALGSSVHSLTKLLPSLADMLELRNRDDEEGAGQEEDDPENNSSPTTVTDTTASHRFRFAISKFLQTLSTWKPVVLVLDDLQWADAESFHLFDSLLELPPERTNLVIVGCHRSSNEPDDYPALETWLQKLGDNFATKDSDTTEITRLPLSNLSVDAVNDLIASVLNNMDAHQTMELATVVHSKTLGNPFFVVQFLKSLHDQQLLTFHLGLVKWIWDLPAIESTMNATDNVVSLMQQKMKTLSPEWQQRLPIAASLGSSFWAPMLYVLVDQLKGRHQTPDADSTTTTTAQQWMDACVDHGFLSNNITHGNGDLVVYSWVHDKVQEAALALLPPDELIDLQYQMGLILLEELSVPERSTNVLVIVNLLMKGLHKKQQQQSSSFIVKEEKEKGLAIAQLCLEAGRTSMASASFAQAAVYLRAGIDFLPGDEEDRWSNEEYRELTLELYTSATEAEYCSGDSTHMLEHCRAITDQTNLSMTDRFRAYNVLMPHVWSQNDYQRASDIAVHVLDELGCTLPKKFQMFHVVTGILKLKRAMKSLGPYSIVSHNKLLTDTSKKQAMIMMDKLATVSYVLKSPYLPLAILKSFRWSIKYGMSEYTPSAFALVALIMRVTLKDYELSRTYAEYAVSLVESQPEFEVAKSRTLFVAHEFVLHSSTPYQSCLKRFLQGYESGLATGDVESACWNTLMYLDMSFLISKSLPSLDEDWSVYSKQMRSFSQLQQMFCGSHRWQAVKNLMGQSEDPLVLKGNVFDVDTFDFEKEEKPVVISCFRAMTHLAYFMFDNVNGADIVLNVHRLYSEEDIDPGAFFGDTFRAHSGVLCYAAFRQTRKKKYLARGKKAHKHIRFLGKKGNPNYPQLEKLLDAEYAALRGRKSAAKKCYQDAIALAARSGLVHEQAVINERYADYMVECGDHNEAHYCYTCAVNLYNEWGAVVKADPLQQKIQQITPNRPNRTRPHPQPGGFKYQ